MITIDVHVLIAFFLIAFFAGLFIGAIGFGFCSKLCA